MDLASDKPVLFSYSGDATPLLCVAGVTDKLGEKAVWRKGNMLVDLFMQRGYLKTIPSTGKEQIVVLLAVVATDATDATRVAHTAGVAGIADAAAAGQSAISFRVLCCCVDFLP